MIKNFFVAVAIAAVFAACGGNTNANQNGECKDSVVCIGKAIENPAEFAGKEAAFGAKIAKCDSTGIFYACADSTKVIEIVPAEGVVLTDAVGKVVKLTGTLVDGKLNVTKCEAATCCSDGKMTDGSCTGEKKEGCCSEKKEGCSEKKEGCSEKKDASANS